MYKLCWDDYDNVDYFEDFQDFQRYSIDKFAADGSFIERKWSYAAYAFPWRPEDFIISDYEWDDVTLQADIKTGVVREDDKWFLIDIQTGKRINDNAFEALEVSPDGRHFSYAKKEWGSGRGLMTIYGRIIFDPVYDTMPIPLSERGGRFLAVKDGKKGIIESSGSGRIIVPFGEYNDND